LYKVICRLGPSNLAPFTRKFTRKYPGCVGWSDYPGLQDSVSHFPTPFSKDNNASVRNNSAFVSEAVNDLLKLDLVKKYFAPRTLLIRSLFLLALRANKD